MALSLRELKEYLINKQGYTATPKHSQLNDLIDLLNNMYNFRNQPEPGTGSGYYSGVTCTGHTGTSYEDDISLGDINAKAASVKPCTCHSVNNTTCYCQSRSACNCVSRNCNCVSRDACNCVSRSACNCVSRTYCDCVSRTYCDCVTRLGITNPCSCNSRTSVCLCQLRYYEPNCRCYTRSCGHCSCDSRTCGNCYCNTRTCSHCSCNARTCSDCSCNSRTSCSCNSRTCNHCSCNGRCACNVEYRFG